jgi:putative membrane protein
MSEILGGCERIDTTPIPYTYRVLLNRTVTIYSLLLPMGLVSSIGWLTPPIAVFIAYTYLALEVIGEELEEPFGREGNDLPLAALCHTIESAVREMQGSPVTVEAPQPEGCICIE